jgi:hypothetical protein
MCILPGWSGSNVHHSEHRGRGIDVFVLDGVDVSSLFDVHGSIQWNSSGLVDAQGLREEEDIIHARKDIVAI